MHRHRLTRQQSREQTRERLLDAAATVITSKGLAATTVEDIVEHASYTRGAFYSNFNSKLELFGELLKADQARIKNGLRQLLDSSLRKEDLEHALASRHHRHQHSMLWAEARHHAMRDTKFRQLLNALILELLDLIASLIDESCERMKLEPSISTRELALMTMALIDGSLYFDMNMPNEKPGGTLRAHLNTLFIAAFSGNRA
ncbi:TetR/AcrR family transcriptional regulator [Dyella sp. Tek66A03]|uniref:TetR/AcrR family transcriptional regulator n=1 Tax=Dyella sp. Tek66A03 TaxID=3458298 RepID=UPI00403E5A4D